MIVNPPQKISIALKPNPNDEPSSVAKSPQKAPRKRPPKKTKKAPLGKTESNLVGGGTSELKTEQQVTPVPPVKPEVSRMINPPGNFFVQSKQILPVISEFQQQTPAREPATTATITAVDENHKNELIKKLLNAKKLSVDEKKTGTVKPLDTGISGRPVTSVTEQELKSIGISLKHQEHLSSMSPAKSDDTSSIKSGGSTQPSTPTSGFPPDPVSSSGSLMTVVPPSSQVQPMETDTAVKTEPGITVKTEPSSTDSNSSVTVKTESKEQEDVKTEQSKADKEKSRKRKNSQEKSKPAKKRKKPDGDSHTALSQLAPIKLAEAPIRSRFRYVIYFLFIRIRVFQVKIEGLQNGN